MTVRRTEVTTGRELPEAQRRILARCVHPQGTFVAFPTDDVQGSIPARFAHVVRLHARRTAIQAGDRRLTYAQLDAATNRLARAIEAAVPDGRDTVGLVIGHGLSAAVAMLATLKAGKAFVPIDPRFPVERLSFMLLDSEPGVLLMDARHRDSVGRLAGPDVPIIDIDAPNDTHSHHALGGAISPEEMAGLVYTSGSTGRPKGVPITHRHMLSWVANWTNTIHICPQDRVSLLASGTGQAIMNILLALLNGATLCPFDVRAEGVARMVRWLIDEEITSYWSSAPLFRQFVASLAGTERFPMLRVARLASDTVTPRDIESYKRVFADECILVNGLSLTETGTLVRFLIDKDTTLDTETVPVGYAMPGMEVTVLDEQGRPAPPGEVGEITAANPFLPQGYWRAPELSAERFRRSATDPGVIVCRTGDLGRMHADGCLEHLGRADSVVKIRGYRVEPAEVERAIRSLDGVSAAVVLADVEVDDRKRLVAYVVTRDHPGPSVGVLRARVAESLPDYMVPSAFVQLEALPLTVGGKLDRTALPKPGRARPLLTTPFVAPRDEVERLLARIWAEVLGLDEVGVEDNFLELGGDSVLAAQVVSRAIDTLIIDLPMHALYESPTVAAMALAIGRVAQESTDREALERLLAGVDTLSDAEVRDLLARQGDRGPDV